MSINEKTEDSSPKNHTTEPSEENSTNEVLENEEQNSPEETPSSSNEDESTSEQVSSQQELLQIKDAFLRLSADFENFRKRVDKDRANWSNQAREEVLLSFLPILDNLKISLKTLPKDEHQSFFQGIEIIIKQWENIFEDLGVKKISCLNEVFDPQFHEALSYETHKDYDDNIIFEEIVAGYLYKGNILRHAQVKVSQKEKQ